MLIVREHSVHLLTAASPLRPSSGPGRFRNASAPLQRRLGGACGV